MELPVETRSPLGTRPLIARTSTPRTSSKTNESHSDGDDKLKNFFQSLLVNKGK